MINLKVNGKDHAVDVAPDTPLLWVIRETIGLTGTKFGSVRRVLRASRWRVGALVRHAGVAR